MRGRVQALGGERVHTFGGEVASLLINQSLLLRKLTLSSFYRGKNFSSDQANKLSRYPRNKRRVRI